MARLNTRFLAPLALGAAMNPINSTMISTALTPIARDLGATVAEVGWLIAGLYLASAVAQPTLGRLADQIGARRVYLGTLVLVALAGLLGLLAASLAALTGVRVLLGIGTSGAYPSAMRLFRDRAGEGAAAPRLAMASLSLAAIVTMAVGPVLGGVLTSAFGWPAIFGINLPVALLAILLVLRWIPADPAGASQSWRRVIAALDPVGACLFAVAILAAMGFLLNADRARWPLLAVAVVDGVAFASWSIRRTDPFLDVRMIANNAPLAVTYVRQFALSLINYCAIYGFAQWLENAGGYSAAQAGWMMLPLSVVAAFTSFAGTGATALRSAFLLCAGAALASSLMLLGVSGVSPAWMIVLASLGLGMTTGLGSTAGQVAIYGQAPLAAIGAAAGLQRSFGYLGAIGSTALLGLLYGPHATDAGFHRMLTILACISASLFFATIFDPTIRAAKVGRSA